MRHLPSGRITQSMRMLLVILLLIPTSCGTDPYHKHKLSFETLELEHYTKLFERDYKEYTGRDIRVTDLIIRFKSINEREGSIITIGKCHTKFNTTPIIVIDAKYWEYTNHLNKKRLMYHELGHCILDYGHLSGGIMAAITIPYKEYEENEEYYLDLFFNHSE